jgi:hypothetical protein
MAAAGLSPTVGCAIPLSLICAVAIIITHKMVFAQLEELITP